MEPCKTVKPYSGMVIRESVIFAPGVYNFFGKEGLIISGENIEINGNGCVFIGGKTKAGKKDDSYSSEFSYGYGEMADDGLGYHGTGIRMDKCHRVKLHNVCVRGFERGLFADGCVECEISDNDFSYNYHNPDWGWDEHEDMGGMIFQNSHRNEIRNNKATDVWSALVLRECNDNSVHHNNCSHTSNVGLRMWLSSRNIIEENDFSWGLRKEPDEVHARDSSCVLIEAASCNNVLKKNDMRFGGDGLFIRSLNNQMSMYNLFEENDTSFANNNAIEAWDAHNTYIRNKANYSSYGFWLGCSDHTVLIDNEVIGNGSVFQNAPEAFGNAGVAVVNGSGNDFYLENNRIEGNSGPGLAIRYRSDEPAKNWVLVRNRICGNLDDARGYRGHGIYLKNVCGVHLIENQVDANEGNRIFMDENVSEVIEEAPGTVWERAEIFCETEFPEMNHPYRFWIDGCFDEYHFYTDDGQYSEEKSPVFSFDKYGKIHIRVLARRGNCLVTGEKNFYVMTEGTVVPELSKAEEWYPADENDCGREGQKLCWRRKKAVGFICRTAPVSIKGQTHFSLFCHYENDFIDMEEQAKGPYVVLCDTAGKKKRIVPDKGFFNKICARDNAAKYEWTFLDYSLKEEDGFCIETDAGFNETIASVEVRLETPRESTGCLEIRQAKFCRRIHVEYDEVWNPQEIPARWRDSAVRVSSGKVMPELFGDLPYCYGATRHWESDKMRRTEEWELHFGTMRSVDALELGIYVEDSSVTLPDAICIKNADGQKVCECTQIHGGTLLFENLNLNTECIQICFDKRENTRIGIWKCRVLRNRQLPPQLQECGSCLHLQRALIRLNVQRSSREARLCDLEYALYETNEADMLASRLIYRGSVAADCIHPGEEASLEFGGVTLEKGQKCHLLLWQKTAAEGVQDGAYYRWVGSGIAPIDGTYGYISGLIVKDKDMTGWGRNYLKLEFDEVVWDGSVRSEGMGNRFGLKGMEQLYQKFQVPRTKKFGEYEGKKEL